MNRSASHHNIRLVFTADRYVVIDKPPGLLAVPGRTPENADCAACRVCAMFPHATGPIVCHRLDQATSGLMVFALDPDAQRLISLQFQRGRVEKRYHALLRGRPHTTSGTVELPLRTDWPNRPRQIVDHIHGKPALTHWRALTTSQHEHPDIASSPHILAQTRVEFEPATGKTHQLRVHAATPADRGGIGCPIVGDELYDPEHPAPRLMLHAAALTFTDPDSLRRVRLESPAPF